MRVAKSNQLRRLLQTQDVVLSVMIAAWVIDAAWLLGVYSTVEVLNLMKLLGIIGMCGGIASVLHYPRLHGQSALHFFFYAARFTFIVLSGTAILFWLSGFAWHDYLVSIIFGCALVAVIFLNRLWLRWWYLEGRKEHRANFIKVVIVGSGNRAQRLVEEYHKHVDWSVDIIACFDPEETDDHRPRVRDIEVMQGLEAFADLLAMEIVDEVVICLPRSLLGKIEPVMAACEEQGICVKFLADLYPLDVDRFSMETVGAIPVLNVEPVLVGTGQMLTKRLADLVLTVALISVLWPVLILVAIAIKLESGGPVLFTQTRVGLNKRPFKMYKFRSMRQDAESEIDQMDHLNEANGPIFKIENDPRVTRVGLFLRRFSLDELPQLFNILLGHMSVVGPRPMSVRDVTRFNRGFQQRRFSVRPGLACLREIQGRSSLSFDQWLELDLEYIDTWSFLLDLKIVLKLIPVVIIGKGAY